MATMGRWRRDDGDGTMATGRWRRDDGDEGAMATKGRWRRGDDGDEGTMATRGRWRREDDGDHKGRHYYDTRCGS